VRGAEAKTAGPRRSLYGNTKAATKRLLNALGVGDATSKRYRRSLRVRRARAFLEAGFLYPDEREAILRDFSDVCLHTQLSIAGICNLEALARHVVSLGLSGAFVECGTWRGGALGFWARSFLRNAGVPSKSSIWGFDSFEGMPQMTEKDGDFTARWLYERPITEVPSELLRGEFSGTERNVASEEDVWSVLSTSQFPRDGLHVVKGWFQESLAKNADAIGPIAILRIDGDFYASTRVCLEKLFDRVVPGGAVIIDDYGVFPGCRRATDEFLEERKLAPPLLYVDVAVRYFFKA
jgi:O-methyltransferase